MILKIKFSFLFLITGTILFSQNKTIDVEKIIHREMKEQHIPGLQIAIVQNGKMILNKSYGIANIEDSVAVNDRSVFAINSCTKVFTGVAVMQLAEEGKINLSAPVSNYLDDLPVNWQRITIKQLLTHISGLPDVINLNPPSVAGLGELTEARAWEKLKTIPMDFQTGEQTRYNQTNYLLLGKVIEKVCGKPFTQFFKERQFQVADMPATVFGDSRDVIPHVAPTYIYTGNAAAQHPFMRSYFEFPYFLRTAGGLNSTAGEMGKWMIALQQGLLFRKKVTLDTMWAAGSYNNGTPTPWALGWGITKFRTKHKAVGMSGGNRSALLVYPDDNLSIVILTNLKGSSPENFIEEIASCYIPEIASFDPLTFLQINLQKKGFENAITVVNEQKKKDPSFKTDENELNNWAYRMMARDLNKEALEIFKLVVFLYPGSWNAFDSYGEGLLKNGQKEEAMKMYKRSVELNPDNANGKKVLEQYSNQH